MAKGDHKENSPGLKRRRKARVAGEDSVTGIPLIVLDGIGIEVPLVVIPVRVHGPELRAMCPPYDYPLNTLRVTIFRSLEALWHIAPILFFF